MMDEALAYKWAAQALKPLDDSGWEPHRHQQAADTVASAILEAYKLGVSEGIAQPMPTLPRRKEGVK